MHTGFVSRLSRLLPLAILWMGVSAPQTPADTLATADKDYAEQSYLLAHDEYALALKTGGAPRGRLDEVRYRIVECLGKSKHWEQSFDEGVAFLKWHRGTALEPRVLPLMGRLSYKGPDNQHRLDSTS